MTPAACLTGTTMRDFGVSRTAGLLHDVAQAIGKAATAPDPEAVHKMRVAIRRLQQSLRLFRQFLRKKGVRAVREDLRSLMDPAGELRNLDIALGLIRRAGGDTDLIRERRKTARLAFHGTLTDMAHHDLEARWRKQLGISGEEEKALEG